MSCKSGLYAANTSAQQYASGAVISFGNIVRRFGGACQLSGGNVQLEGTGYYDIDVNVSFQATAGTTVIQLYKDGTAIPGAEATVTTIADTYYSVTIPALIRETCNCESVITAVISGTSGTINNAAVTAEKI